MVSRIVFTALVCLAASGCAIPDGFVGPPFVWVEDRASAQPGGRSDGYPTEPVAIAEFPGLPL